MSRGQAEKERCPVPPWPTTKFAFAHSIIPIYPGQGNKNGRGIRPLTETSTVFMGYSLFILVQDSSGARHP